MNQKPYISSDDPAACRDALFAPVPDEMKIATHGRITVDLVYHAGHLFKIEPSRPSGASQEVGGETTNTKR